MESATPDTRRTARGAADKLRRAGVPEPEASAEVLLSELLGVGRADLALYYEPLTGEQLGRYEVLVSRREKREPVQRILGHAPFRNLTLEVSGETLVPRADTESVVDAALERIDRRGGRCRILDLGTGTGAIAVAVAQERAGCEVHATDFSAAALKVARRNAKRAGVEVRFYRADLVSGPDLPEKSVEVLVSNPPYIPTGDLPGLPPEVRDWDPPGALDGGPDGLLFYRRIFRETPPLLADGADVVLEVGDGQADAVLELGRAAGFTRLGTRPDLTGTPRAALLRWESG